MAKEVCYERLHPREVVAEREVCPVAYLPIGTLEWHGHHSPLGADTVKAHGLAIRCAQAGGGLVFPPLYYGESRSEGLMETGAEDKEKIHSEMGLGSENFGVDYMRFTPQEQCENYQRLLLHCLMEMESLGFKVLVLSVGHYPLIDHARAACSVFHQIRYGNTRPRAIGWAFTGYELVRDVFPTAGDHAGYWETSLLMALEPGLVDLDELPDELVGVKSHEPVGESSAEFGERAIGLIVERVVAQVKDRLDNYEKYAGHGAKL
ncbi:MAG: creatininase family protein [Planctomycetota bacterium]|jgi:creatinine amidohydrolase